MYKEKFESMNFWNTIDPIKCDVYNTIKDAYLIKLGTTLLYHFSKDNLSTYLYSFSYNYCFAF